MLRCLRYKSQHSVRLQTMAHCNSIKSLCLDRLNKTLKLGSFPTINLPKKSHEESKPSTSRWVIEKKELVPSKVYKDINNLKLKVSKLVLKGWCRKGDDNAFTLTILTASIRCHCILSI